MFHLPFKANLQLYGINWVNAQIVYSAYIEVQKEYNIYSILLQSAEFDKQMSNFLQIQREFKITQ